LTLSPTNLPSPHPFTRWSGYAAARPGRATPQLPDGAGIIPRAIADIFTTVHRREAAQLAPVAIYCSFVQIYNEQVCFVRAFSAGDLGLSERD
jgi:hypothetical protein